MNAFQKKQVIALRRSGETFAKIAENLGLSVNTVKSYCRRNSGNNEAEGGNGLNVDIADIGGACPQCGNIITLIKGRKPKRFCSDECRVRWWNSHFENVNKKAVYPFKCVYCGKDFTAYGNAKRRYCSHSCYCKDRFNRNQADRRAATV